MDEFIEPCSVDELVFSRVSPTETGAIVLASVEVAREFGMVRGCLAFDNDDETSENWPSRPDGDGSICLSFKKINAHQKGVREISLKFLVCPCQRKQVKYQLAVRMVAGKRSHLTAIAVAFIERISVR